MMKEYNQKRQAIIERFKDSLSKVKLDWERKMRDDTYGNQACDKSESTGSYQVAELDGRIKLLETNIEEAREFISRKNNELKQLKKVRKLVTPEMEAAIKAMKSIRLI